MDVIRLGMTSHSKQSIADLLVNAKSPNLGISGPASRELLSRHVECSDHVQALIELLQNPNAAISDYAFRTIERIGSETVAELLAAYEHAKEQFKLTLMGLIAGIADFGDYMPLLQNELRNGGMECRIWAANCIGRKYNPDWPDDAIKSLDESVNILLSLQGDAEHWSQARITLRELGRLP